MNTALLSALLLLPAADPSATDLKDRVDRGLKWLAAKQNKDGYWDMQNNLATTQPAAMAGLAFLMEGSTLSSGRYKDNLNKLLKWLEKNTSEDGKIASTEQTEAFQYIHGHAHALMFLACAYDVEDDPVLSARLKKHIEKAIEFAAKAQSSRGGWGFVRAADVNDYEDSQSTTLVLHALLTAEKAGFSIPKDVIDRGISYLSKATNNEGGIIYTLSGGQVPRGNDGQPSINAAAAATLLMTDRPRPATFTRWIKNADTITEQQLRTVRGGGVFVLMQFFQTARYRYSLGETGHGQVDPDLKEAKRLKWTSFRNKAYKALLEEQSKDGSWPDAIYSPAFPTAMALILLQLDNDYIPAFSR